MVARVYIYLKKFGDLHCNLYLSVVYGIEISSTSGQQIHGSLLAAGASLGFYFKPRHLGTALYLKDVNCAQNSFSYNRYIK